MARTLPATFTPELFHQLELLRMHSRRAYLGTRQGGHRSVKRGHGTEFADYRNYYLGDDPRHIDWGVYARTDRLYVKRFQEDQDLSVLVVIDGSTSMITPAEDNKWEFARDLGLAISYVALMQQDRVSVCIPGHYYGPTYAVPTAIHHLGKTLTSLEVGKSADFSQTFHKAISRVRLPGLVVFISDLLIPPSEVALICDRFRARNFDLHVIQVLGAHDLLPFDEGAEVYAVDSETEEETPISFSADVSEEYQVLLERHNEALEALFYERQVPFARAQLPLPLDQFIIDRLSRTGLLS